MVKQQDMATPAPQGCTSYGVGPSAEAQRQANRALVTQAHEALFTRHDVYVLDTSFAPGFIEHSPLVKDGLSGLRQLVAECPDMRHEAVRVLADGDLVAIHGRFIGLAETPLVGFDIYRVAQGRIVEHWDGLVPEAPPNASGHTQLDGTIGPGQGDAEANRAFITRFFTETLIGSDYSGFRRFTDGTHFVQHSPDIGDGVDAVISFLNGLVAQGSKLEYRCIHRTVAEGEFVLTHSEGSIATHGATCLLQCVVRSAVFGGTAINASHQSAACPRHLSEMQDNVSCPRGLPRVSSLPTTTLFTQRGDPS